MPEKQLVSQCSRRYNYAHSEDVEAKHVTPYGPGVWLWTIQALPSASTFLTVVNLSRCRLLLHAWARIFVATHKTPLHVHQSRVHFI